MDMEYGKEAQKALNQSLDVISIFIEKLLASLKSVKVGEDIKKTKAFKEYEEFSSIRLKEVFAEADEATVTAIGLQAALFADVLDIISQQGLNELNKRAKNAGME